MDEAERQEIWFRRAYLSKTLKNIVAEKMNSGEKFTDGQMKMNKLVNEDVPKLLDTVVFLESQVEKQARLAENWHNAYKEKRKVEERLRKRNERMQKEREGLRAGIRSWTKHYNDMRIERDEWKAKAERGQSALDQIFQITDYREYEYEDMLQQIGGIAENTLKGNDSE